MTPEQLEEVIQATTALKERQAQVDSPADVAKLPKLGLDDLDRKAPEIPVEVDKQGDVTYLTHELPTSGIVYADVCFDAASLTLDDLPLLPLLTSCFLEVGTTSKHRVALSREIGTHTGGMRTALLLAQPSAGEGLVGASDSILSYVCLRAKAVAGESERLFNLLHEVSTDANLDDQRRVVEMLKESVASFRAQIPAAGHTYADTRLRARHTAAGFLAEATGGIMAFDSTKELLEEAENDWDALSAKLKALRAKLVAADGLVINLTGDSATLEAAKPHAEALAAKLPGSKGIGTGTGLAKAPIDSLPSDEGLAVPTQVNYVGKGGRLYSPGEKVRCTPLPPALPRVRHPGPLTARSPPPLPPGPRGRFRGAPAWWRASCVRATSGTRCA